jgi:glucose/arabinose dehydrogenase
VVFDKLPSDGHHGWKFIAFGPDGALYIPVGAPCNVCEVKDPYGTILRLDVATGALEVIARGVRNSVGFDWHPRTQELWFSDNGRDMLGDDVPPGELNRIAQTGRHFGFPYIHGGDIVDPEFGKASETVSFEKPAWQLGAHVAPLGMMFYTGREFPEEYRGSLLVAEHGSWNRSRKVGYRVMRAVFDPDAAISSYVPFITGWLQGEAYWGRPVDFEQLPDGSVLVSDDHAGAIYRISYDTP